MPLDQSNIEPEERERSHGGNRAAWMDALEGTRVKKHVVLVAGYPFSDPSEETQKRWRNRWSSRSPSPRPFRSPTVSSHPSLTPSPALSVRGRPSGLPTSANFGDLLNSPTTPSFDRYPPPTPRSPNYPFAAYPGELRSLLLWLPRPNPNSRDSQELGLGRGSQRRLGALLYKWDRKCKLYWEGGLPAIPWGGAPRCRLAKRRRAGARQAEGAHSGGAGLGWAPAAYLGARAAGAWGSGSSSREAVAHARVVAAVPPGLQRGFAQTFSRDLLQPRRWRWRPWRWRRRQLGPARPLNCPTLARAGLQRPAAAPALSACAPGLAQVRGVCPEPAGRARPGPAARPPPWPGRGPRGLDLPTPLSRAEAVTVYQAETCEAHTREGMRRDRSGAR
ncbi:uncharacterized protein [Macaca fascicularis]|uniref:uncharacterized protein n=1 Tax=Macaca fascicularis TaxID=9541 RepID=UPI0032B06F69